MFMAELEAPPTKSEEEFSRPVESIMRCEDFKSNFARRLSNRYTSRPVSVPKQETSLKLCPNINKEETSDIPERIEKYPQLLKNIAEQNGESMKPRDVSSPMTDFRGTEVTALNIEVGTLRWQLAQTEANRQMHIALLKQIVTFLNKVRDHIDNQKNESSRKDGTMSTRVSPRSFNVADLPRSRSVLHVNKNLEYLNPPKKISTKKISKSISNVNGYKECVGVWNQSKVSLVSEKETAHKISEEMSRLITLANTVLSTKLPDLACTCIDNIENNFNKSYDITDVPKGSLKLHESPSALSQIKEDSLCSFTVTGSDSLYENLSNKSIEAKDISLNDLNVTPSPLTCGLENDFIAFEINEKDHQSPLSSKNVAEQVSGKPLTVLNDKRNEYSHVSNFIEDESGFSSMSSFQEIGIPIISIIPPSPCKEIEYIEEMPDVLKGPENWKPDDLEINKQTVKVFWV